MRIFVKRMSLFGKLKLGIWVGFLANEETSLKMEFGQLPILRIFEKSYLLRKSNNW